MMPFKLKVKKHTTCDTPILCSWIKSRVVSLMAKVVLSALLEHEIWRLTDRDASVCGRAPLQTTPTHWLKNCAGTYNSTEK